MAATDVPGIVKTPDVCGGDACIGMHRICVWMLVGMKRLGASDDDLLIDYPQLTPADLEAGWAYYRAKPVEVERAIWRNDTVGNVPPGTHPPPGVIIAGKLLGLSDEEVMEAFDDPITPADLAAAWQAYLATPAEIEREIATLRRAG